MEGEIVDNFKLQTIRAKYLRVKLDARAAFKGKFLDNFSWGIETNLRSGTFIAGVQLS